MSNFEKLTKPSLLRHMNDDPCVVCGVGGHDAWAKDICQKLKGPTGSDSPLTKIYGPKANPARQAILKYHTSETRLEETQEATDEAQPSATQPVNQGAQDHAATASEDLILNSIIASTGNAVDNLKKVRNITQAEPVEAHASASIKLPETATLGQSNEFKPKPLISTAKNAQFPLRTEFARTISDTVFTNHFEVNFKPDTRFFVYEILKIPTEKSKRKAKYIFKTAEEAWNILKDNKEHYATDHVNTIVAWKNLHDSISDLCVIPGDPTTQIGSVWQPDPIADGKDRIQLFIKLHRELDLAGLNAYIDAGDSGSNPDFNFSPVVTALNLAVTKSLTTDVFQQSTNKFFVKCGSQPLGRTLCSIRGYYYTMKPAMQKVLLNANTATSTFFAPITVAEYLADDTFLNDERERLLKTLRVYIEPPRLPDPANQEHVDHLNKPQNRIKTFFSLGKPLEHKDMTFRKTYKNAQGQLAKEQKYTHVVDHMKKVFGREFDSTAKAINVGTEADPVYYPGEYLRILPYQIYKRLLPEKLVETMLGHASNSPTRSRQLIEVEGMKSLGLDPTQCEQEMSGCSRLLIKPTMMEIPSARMPNLEIVYGGKTPNATPNNNAQWNLRSLKHFMDSPGSTMAKKQLNYLLLVESGMQDVARTIDLYTKEFNKSLIKYNVCADATYLGMKFVDGIRNGESTYDSLKEDMEQSLDNMKQAEPSANFAILLLESRNIPAYCAFKDIADRQIPMQSLCLTQSPNSRKDNIDQYMANIMMKVNLKLGGGNHTVKLNGTPQSEIKHNLQDTLVLGADVTHPGSSSLIGCPSIAAVVGSVDSTATKFRGSMRLQNTCKEEIIDDIEDMVKERITDYVATTRALPKNILFYRDGVSTSQFAKVRDQELVKIKSACKKADILTPKITIIVAVKRHATRFYPASAAAHPVNGNCMPGTLVDQVVTSPHYSDFYLQSHNSLKGTAIPTHYVVIANEMQLSDTKMQQLTHQLCYTYARATMGVSYAPPAYYADRLCDRGRAYLRNYFSPDKTSAHYAAYLATRKRIEEQNQPVLDDSVNALPTVPTRFGRNAPRKSEAQIAIERAHRKRVDGLVEMEILAEARTEWNRERQGGLGPWGKELDKTMFWM